MSCGQAFTLLFRLCDAPAPAVVPLVTDESDIVRTVVESMTQAPLNMRLQLAGIRLLALWSQRSLRIDRPSWCKVLLNFLYVCSRCFRMQYASMIAKGSTGDPTVLPAKEVLEMATIRGARALGMEKETGSLQVGKAADMVAVDLGCIEASPVFDPLGQLVYTNSRQVSHVWIDGRCVVYEGNVQTLAVDLAATESIVSKLREFRRSLPSK
eukprot:g9555.t1